MRSYLFAITINIRCVGGGLSTTDKCVSVWVIQ